MVELRRWPTLCSAPLLMSCTLLMSTTGCTAVRERSEPAQAYPQPMVPQAEPLRPEPVAPYEDSPQTIPALPQNDAPLPLKIPAAARAPLPVDPEEAPADQAVTQENAGPAQPMPVPSAGSLTPGSLTPSYEEAVTVQPETAPSAVTPPVLKEVPAETVPEKATTREKTTATSSSETRTLTDVLSSEEQPQVRPDSVPLPESATPEVTIPPPAGAAATLPEADPFAEPASEKPPVLVVPDDAEEAIPTDSPQFQAIVDALTGAGDAEATIPVPAQSATKTVEETKIEGKAGPSEEVPARQATTVDSDRAALLPELAPEPVQQSILPVITPADKTADGQTSAEATESEAAEIGIVPDASAGSAFKLPVPEPSPRVVASTAPVNPIVPVPPKRFAPVLFTELPAFADDLTFDRDGNAYVAHRAGISRITPAGEPALWSRSGQARGLALLPDGSMAISDQNLRAVLRLNSSGEPAGRLATRSDGFFLRAPSDLVIDSGHGLYFIDPGYARIRNAIGKIHYIAPNGSVSIVAQNLAFPEGLALSADESRLLVLEGQTGRVLSFEILAPGSVGPKQVICTMEGVTANDEPGQSDADRPVGLAVDLRGRIFVGHSTAGRIDVFEADGKPLTVIPLRGLVISNLVLPAGTASPLYVTGGIGSEHGRGRVFAIDISGL